MTRPRIIALSITAAVALLIVLLLHVGTLTVGAFDREWPPRHDSDVAIAEVEEQFFDVIQAPPAPSREQASPAPLPEPAVNKSTPAPESGHDVVDRGPAGDAPKTVTSKRPSPVKVKEKEKPRQAGPSKEELERQRAAEEARRRANAATATAFQRSEGKNNTSSSGKTEGDSGRPDGTSATVSGTGTGTVGGGWALPRYAKVPATTTGSIKMMVKVDRDGRVKSVSFQGGDAPAATDARLRRAVEAEVRSRRFTRPTAEDAPPEATAYITYRFK